MTSSRGLIVFDCDGVLVDTERLVQEIDQEMIPRLGWPITAAEIHQQHLGRSTADLAANIERKIGRSLPEGWLEARRRRHRDVFARRLQAIPGVKVAIAQLTAAGYATCVASSGSPADIRLRLSLTGPWDAIDEHVFSSTEVTNGKPAPDLFLHAAAMMGFAPRRCIVVEDSPAGVAAGRAAAMKVIGYAALTPRDLLGRAHASISNMADLAGTVKTLEHP